MRPRRCHISRAARMLFFSLSICMAWPAAVHGQQGMTITRQPDPSKPRDGYGLRVEAFFTSTLDANGKGGSMRATDYPRVRAIDPGTPADSARILPGDVLLSANGVDLMEHSHRWDDAAGTVLTLRIRRGTTTREVKLTSVRLYSPPAQ